LRSFAVVCFFAIMMAIFGQRGGSVCAPWRGKGRDGVWTEPRHTGQSSCASDDEEAVERMTRARSRTRVDNATNALGDSVGGEKINARGGGRGRKHPETARRGPDVWRVSSLRTRTVIPRVVRHARGLELAADVASERGPRAAQCGRRRVGAADFHHAVSVCVRGKIARGIFFRALPAKSRLHAATLKGRQHRLDRLARHSPSREVLGSRVEPRISAMETIRETLEKAGGVPESARVAIDGGVDAVVHTLSKQVAVAAEHVAGYADVASAHADAASYRLKEYEDRFFRVPTLTVTNAVTSYPYQTAAGALGASLLIVPATRRLFVKALLGARSSEEAIFNRASRGAASVKDSVGAAEKELKALRDAAVAAEVEMLRGRTSLERAAKGLKALSDRTRKDAIAVEDALDELRRLPSAAAVSARADAAMTANQVAKVRRGVDAALQSVWRAGVQI